MQKHWFFRGLITILLWGYSLCFAQSKTLYQLYTTNQFLEIEKLAAEGRITQPDWGKFTSILFIEELDDAITEYISLYNSTRDEQLKILIIDRLSQYYYAKGLYDSAERIIKDDKFRAQIFSINTEKISFGVQLGAYSSYQNAENAKNKFSARIADITIIQKSSGGKVLFALVAGKFTTKDAAERLQKQLQENQKIKGMVVQY